MLSGKLVYQTPAEANLKEICQQIDCQGLELNKADQENGLLDLLDIGGLSGNWMRKDDSTTTSTMLLTWATKILYTNGLSVKRKLRDGVVDGEQAPAILVRDTVRTIGGPLLLRHLLRSICENISGGRAQAKGVVVVALSSLPESYDGFPYADRKEHGSVSWFQVLDCYTDPLGWERGTALEGLEAEIRNRSHVRVHRDVRNLDGLLSLIIESGQGSVGFLPKERFVVVLDSMSILLRYHSLQALMNFVFTLRSHDQVAALSWLVHSDLHESRTVCAFEYASSITAILEPVFDAFPNALRSQHESLQEERVRIRQKRRSGRVREQIERLHFTSPELSFGRFEHVEHFQSDLGTKDVPKVQFNLSLSEKELEDRLNVLLPFEHQGNGEEGKIYDGRHSIKTSYLSSQARELRVAAEDESCSTLGTKELGEIHYLRDSDNEQPDSDEDPDDDLDI